ncbi:MAG: hypothetical protein GYB67_09555 [Chloroflexi bacterium]|nr:hypothetical protein [Chloroflexota bacterium]
MSGDPVLTAAHPRPRWYQLTQIAAVALIVLLILAALAQIALVLLGSPLLLAVVAAVIALALTAPLLMQTTISPPVTVSADGLTLRPLIWRQQAISWAAVESLKPYPLLTPASAEVVRRGLSGRSNYRPAEGMMLVIPALPLPYRVAGLLAGEGFTAVIALTNRTHTDYPALIAAVIDHVRAAGGVVHADAPAA